MSFKPPFHHFWLLSDNVLSSFYKKINNFRSFEQLCLFRVLSCYIEGIKQLRCTIPLWGNRSHMQLLFKNNSTKCSREQLILSALKPHRQKSTYQMISSDTFIYPSSSCMAISHARCLEWTPCRGVKKARVNVDKCGRMNWGVNTSYPWAMLGIQPATWPQGGTQRTFRKTKIAALRLTVLCWRQTLYFRFMAMH